MHPYFVQKRAGTNVFQMQRICFMFTCFLMAIVYFLKFFISPGGVLHYISEPWTWKLISGTFFPLLLSIFFFKMNAKGGINYRTMTESIFSNIVCIFNAISANLMDFPWFHPFFQRHFSAKMGWFCTKNWFYFTRNVVKNSKYQSRANYTKNKTFPAKISAMGGSSI